MSCHTVRLAIEKNCVLRLEYYGVVIDLNVCNPCTQAQLDDSL